MSVIWNQGNPPQGSEGLEKCQPGAAGWRMMWGMGTLPTIPNLVDTGRGYLGRLRLRALGWSLGFGLAAFAVIAWTPIGWVPVVSVAVAAAVMTMSRMATSLDKPLCYSCGADLAGVSDSPQGIACPSCGAVYQGRRRMASGQVDPRAMIQGEFGDEAGADKA